MRLAVWWLSLLGLYVVSISTVDAVELAAGASLAALGAAIAVGSRRAFEVPARPPRDLPRWLRALPAEFARSAPALLGLIASRAAGRRTDAGRFHSVALSGREKDAAARRAYAVLVVSVSPASYATDLTIGGRGADVLVVHTLGAGKRMGGTVSR